MEVTSTYFSTPLQNSHQPLPTNPEGWISLLALSQITDTTGRVFKQIKRILKDYAKRGILFENQRKRILSILSQNGFRTYTDDPRFRGLSVCPTKLLLFSPKLYEILFYPEKHPLESTLLNTLSDAAFEILVDTFEEETLNNIPIGLLVEIIYVINRSSIPELEEICKNSLHRQLTNMNNIGMKTFYLLATIWDRLSLFSHSLTCIYDFPIPDSSEAAEKEFEFFKQVMTGTKEKELEELSPLELCRLFFLIHEESKISPSRISPTLCSLHLKIFDKLLNYLKSGELDAEYSQQLIAEAQDSFDLCKRLKEDQLTIELKNIQIPMSLWSLFPKSKFFQSLIFFRMKQGKPLKQEQEIPLVSLEGLEGVTEESFGLLHNFWMKGKEVNVNALSVEQLIDLLQMADCLQLNNFDNTRRQIETAIIQQCDNTQESMIALVGLNVYCPTLKAYVISWLNRFSFLSIQKIQEGQKDFLKVEIKDLPRLEHLQSALKVLKIILRDPSIKIKLPQNDMTPPEESFLRPLIDLLYLHCCIELELVEEQELLKMQILKLKNLEETEDWYKWKNFHSWGPYDFLTLLSQLPDNVSSHLLALKFHCSVFSSAFWRSVKFCARVDAKALQEEISRFREMALQPEKIFELSAKELPRFFFFLSHAMKEFNLEKSISTRLDNFSWMISKYMKEETLSPHELVRIIQQVQDVYPQEGRFIKDLKLIFDHLQLPIQLLQLLLNSMRGLKILSEIKKGKIFNKIPPKSIEWAFEMIQKASFSDSKSALINLLELKGFSAAHLDALQYLKKHGVDINETEFAEDLSSVVNRLPLETLCAVASWAAANKRYTLIRSCLSRYCQNGLKFSLNRYDFRTGRYILTSLQAKPLNMLEALGTDVKYLEIEINSDSEALKDPWVKIAKACPHVERLYLEITGAVTSLDSLPLTQFPNLRYLQLWVHDSEAWKSLCSLKIPATIEQICFLEIRRNQIEGISNYEFFSYLPPKGIKLRLLDDSSKPTSSWWSYLSLAADPVEKLFRQLSHCTELSIYGRGDVLHLKYLVTHNRRLESLSLDYFRTCLTVDDLQMLKNGLPKLKKFHIELELGSSTRRDKDDLIKFFEEWQEQTKGNTEITWQI